MNGSNGDVISILERIAAELVGMRRDMDAGFAKLDGQLGNVNARLDNLVVFSGKSHADLAKRVTALERKVFKKSG